MKKIEEIYKEYKIIPNLKLHQMRVAAVASMVCDSLEISIDKENIVNACLLHDMGNIIKFKLEDFPQFVEPEGLEYWNKIKYDFIIKYGNDEHLASLEIAKELGVSEYTLELIDCIDSNSEMIKMDTDICKKICIYADNRVSPNGIVSVKERSLEAKERYKNHPSAFDEEKRLFYVENIHQIEKQIFSHSKIKPENIDDISIKKYLEELD